MSSTTSCSKRQIQRSPNVSSRRGIPILPQIAQVWEKQVATATTTTDNPPQLERRPTPWIQPESTKKSKIAGQFAQIRDESRWLELTQLEEDGKAWAHPMNHAIAVVELHILWWWWAWPWPPKQFPTTNSTRGHLRVRSLIHPSLTQGTLWLEIHIDE